MAVVRGNKAAGTMVVFVLILRVSLCSDLLFGSNLARGNVVSDSVAINWLRTQQRVKYKLTVTKASNSSAPLDCASFSMEAVRGSLYVEWRVLIH